MSRIIRKIVSIAMVLSMLLTLTPATASVWDRDAWLSGSVIEDHDGHDHDEETLDLHDHDDHDDHEDLDWHEYTEEELAELAALEAALLELVTDDPLGAGPVADAPADESAEEPEAEPVAELPKAEVSEPAAKLEATAQDDEDSGADDAGAEAPVMTFTVEDDEDSGAAAAPAPAKTFAMSFTSEDDGEGEAIAFAIPAMAMGFPVGSQGASEAVGCSTANHVGPKTMILQDIPATCTAVGYGAMSWFCTACGKYLSGVIIPMADHKYEVFVRVDQEATCQNPRIEIRKCATCDLTKEVPIEGTIEEHIFDEKYGCYESPANCGEDAYEKYYCAWYQSCGQTLTVVAEGSKDSIEHTLDYKNPKNLTKAPTCEEQGLGDYECEECGTTVTGVIIPPTKHDYVPFRDFPATCTKEGYERKICANLGCGDELRGKTIPVRRHYYDWVVTKAATCEANGEEVERCDDCPATRKTRAIKALGHNYKLTETKAATQAEAGYIKYECQNAGCPSNYQEKLSKLAATKTRRTSYSYTTEEFEDYEVPLAGFNSQLGAVDSLTLDTLNQLLDTASLQEMLQALLAQENIRALPLDIGALPEEGYRLPIIVDGEAYLAGYVLIKPSERAGQRGFSWSIEVEDGFSMSNVTLLVAKTLEELTGLETLSSSDDIYSGGGGFVPVNGVILLSLWSSVNYSEAVATVYQKDQTVRARLDELIIR